MNNIGLPYKAWPKRHYKNDERHTGQYNTQGMRQSQKQTKMPNAKTETKAEIPENRKENTVNRVQENAAQNTLVKNGVNVAYAQCLFVC